MDEIKGGFLETPLFGPIPPEQVGRRAHKPFEFEKILAMVRDHPGEWAKIAVYKGGKKETEAALSSARAKVWRWLLTEFPLEDWRVSGRLVKGTWADRELYVKFLGEMTPEEALKMEKLRDDAYSAKAHDGLPHDTRLELKNRAKAIIRDVQREREARLKEG